MLLVRSPSAYAQTTTITDVSFTKTTLFDIDTQTPTTPIIVNATISYEDAKAGYYLAVGIFDLDDGNLVRGLGSSTPQPCSSTAEFAGCIVPLSDNQGSERMQFSLGRPKAVWNLALIAAILDNAQTPISSSFSDYTFTIEARSALTLAVNLPNNVPVNIDGVNGSGTIQLVLAAGNHSLSVPQYVPVDNVTRLKFLGWSDGSTAANRTVELNHDITLTGSYIIQYRLELISPVKINGAGWYDQDALVTLSVQSVAQPMNGIAGVLGGKWTFDGWSEDANEISRARITSLTMNSSHIVKALWTPDYSVPAAIIAAILLLTLFTLCAARTRKATAKTRTRPRRRARPRKSDWRSRPRE